MNPPNENRLGVAVGLLMDAVTLINSEADVAKRINDFIVTVHPAECVDLPGETSDSAALTELKIKAEAMNMVLSVVSAKANVATPKLLELLKQAEEELRAKRWAS